MASASTTKHIAILGAGVTGLQTALSLLTTPGTSTSPLPYTVTVIAAHLPLDSSIDYTSPWAGGHWRSHAHSDPSDAEAREWDESTYHSWRRDIESAIAEREGKGKAEGKERSKAEVEREVEKYLGLGVRESVMYWSEETDEIRDGGRGLWWRDVVTGFQVLDDEALKKERAGVPSQADSEDEKVVFAARYETICINVPRYLFYLTERILALGGKIIRASVDTSQGLDGVVADVQRVISLRKPREEVGEEVGEEAAALDAIVLAAGLLSRTFLPVSEAEKLYPIRGQTVLVRGEAKKAITHVFPCDEISYVIPRPGSDTTILGGTKEAGNWDEKPDDEVTERIITRAKVLVPELLGENGEFEVLGVQVGRRPGRRGGPRVEMEGNGERVRGVRVVYAYGHAGAGYQNSIGSAEKVVRLLGTQ